MEGDSKPVGCDSFIPISHDKLETLSKESLIDAIEEAYKHIGQISSIGDKGENETKLKLQVAELTKRESLLMKTIREKERELSDLAAQMEELKVYQLPSNAQLRSYILEPTVNIVFTNMKKELETTRKRLEDSQSELSAWKFTQDSQTGKQLMARCATLLKENEELGQQIASGRVAKLEGEIALEKKLVDEMKEAQSETDQFVDQLDEETEGMQATILLLQQQLRETKTKLASYCPNEISADNLENGLPELTYQSPTLTEDADKENGVTEQTSVNPSKLESSETNGLVEQMVID